MRELPILFSSPMVAAVIAGNKTQTRRIVKGLPENVSDEIVQIMVSGHHGAYGHVKCPYGKPGDILWVRENWRPLGFNLYDDSEFSVQYSADGLTIVFNPEFDTIEKLDKMIVGECDRKNISIGEDGRFSDTPNFAWRPSIHLPKDLSRIWLRVKSVRVERAQSISENDAIAEGVLKSEGRGYYLNYEDQAGGLTQFIYQAGLSAADSFRTLWSAINGRRSWYANPWVWVVEFEVLSTTGKPENL